MKLLKRIYRKDSIFSLWKENDNTFSVETFVDRKHKEIFYKMFGDAQDVFKELIK